ncbi:sugar phosphate isomerase/epimerase family protein [Neptunicella sp. SCSIO 80796]|uniref:sugar phosphate isomerase/epimerase family protein n=1 Tax=Neptunicella plasticusilytica TaxID=3117012 RepID=UPI003A4E2D43
MKNSPLARRQFIKMALAASATVSSGLLSGLALAEPTRLFKISLAQWSLHKAFRSGEMDPANFASITRKLFNLDAIEYVNQFYFDSLSDKVVMQLKNQAKDEGIESRLIMCDGEGALGDQDAKARKKAVQNHYRWADAAQELGCHSIRVNAQSSGSWDEQMKAAADGLNQLAEYCAPLNLNVIVENHGGLSSNGKWLTGVMKLADNPRVGTLPDFGNFIINRETGEAYDKYQGVTELMPYAKAVSAKTNGINMQGNEPHIDYYKMMKIVTDAGYHDYVGVEYEGSDWPEVEGVHQTIALLERVHRQLQLDANKAV